MAKLVLNKPPIEPPLLVICGPAGAGKTTLGAMFPKPVFIQAERVDSVFDDWEESLIPDVFPRIPSASVEYKTAPVSTLLSQIYQLCDDEHDYQTLVIDSISAMHRLIEQQLCCVYGVENVAEASGGYGKYVYELQKIWMDIIGALQELRDTREMTIVGLAHIDAKQLKARPDGDPVVAWVLQMHEKSAEVWTTAASGVLAIKLDEFIKGAEKDRQGKLTRAGRVVMSGQRHLVTDPSTMGYGMLCKNRFGLPATIKLPVETNPLIPLIPFYQEP